MTTPHPHAQIAPAKLAGRCSDGYERGQGVRIHALANPRRPDPTTIYGEALCKAKPGRRSVGWTPMDGSDVTCPQCLKKLPTHWMDDRGYVVTTEFLNGPKSSSDWRLAYNIPLREVRGKFVPFGDKT